MQTEKRTGVERGSLANAIAIRPPGWNIGRVKSPFSSYDAGHFVLVEVQQNGQLTVEMPMTPNELSIQRSTGSLVKTRNTVINVPPQFVELLTW